MSESKSSSGGVGFAGLLTIAFIVLKLCNMIDWSWWWVISPIWISIGIVLIVMGGVGLYYFFLSVMQEKKLEKRNAARREELRDLQNRCNDLSEQINMTTDSKWQQLMNDMYKQKDTFWSNKLS